MNELIWYDEMIWYDMMMINEWWWWYDMDGINMIMIDIDDN